jgi:hypothetical protein
MRKTPLNKQAIKIFKASKKRIELRNNLRIVTKAPTLLSGQTSSRQYSLGIPDR